MGFIPAGFEFFSMPSPYLELWAAFAGILIGSFLNVLAVRSLASESIVWPPANCFSRCPHCKHRLGIFEIIPIVSYILLKGRCRHCQEKINWHYPLVEAVTGLLFAAIVHHFAEAQFESSPDRLAVTLAMLIFISVLVAVTVTDFKEKLIPHEITYPSIIAGLIYSTVVRHDLLGALAGVGVSYILFDFIAFYGLKFYMMMHEDDENNDNNAESERKEPPSAVPDVVPTTTKTETTLDLDIAIDDELDRSLGIIRAVAPAEASAQNEEDEEPFEVMGGGDAVLSAVLAAWLGWQLLVAALVVGFMIGAIMGAFYLIYELKKEKRLAQVARPAVIGTLIAGGGFGLLIGGFATLSHLTEILVNPTVWLLLLIVSLGGTTAGVIWSGNAIAKPFPFGPALAMGGLYGVFLINLLDKSYIK
ncbi:MAG: prepilin peptidase [Cyanobacteria bacterium REEB67]|nr:prepilin peptidase [Cyanobacteria bacterium REEB67]